VLPSLRAFSLLAACVCLLVALSLPAASGQERAGGSPSQSGDITLEDTHKRPKAASARGSEDLKAWLASLDASFTSGAVKEPRELSDEGVHELAALYFFCAVRAGSCPFILDTALESDVIVSKNEREASCPTMSRFWKVWVAGDFDQHARYAIGAGAAEQMDSFNTQERPSYVKCKGTVAEILEDRSNLEARYQAGGEARTSLDRTTKLLDDLAARGVNYRAGAPVSR